MGLVAPTDCWVAGFELESSSPFNSRLSKGGSLLSHDRHYAFHVTSACNLIFFELGEDGVKFVWATGTLALDCVLSLSFEGVLGLFDKNDFLLWSTPRQCSQPCLLSSSLVIQRDGNVVLYSNAKATWDTGTNK
ncbi:lectin [Selaginella moellendorffii]|uniref:Lectin n=1 Tax=Selaginella moellendorffii TaxID=88036 RepID=D8QQJ9_SELML|nr:lectin [Selaginella moellendorffii]